MILFHPEPARFITGATVKIGYFRRDSDLVFQDEISGDLFSVVEKTMDLLVTKYLKAEIGYVGIQREEKLPVAEEALREAILNAVAHKDYASNTPVQISVYGDRVMIWNNGVLQNGWTIETLKGKHPSQPFNPDIAHVLFLAGMIESWGRGIEKMASACKKHGCGGPHLKQEEVGFWVEFNWNAPNAQIIYSPTSLDILGLDRPLTKNQKQVLYLMDQTPAITISELAIKVGVTERTVERYLSFFRDKNLVSRVGNKQGGAWLLDVIVDKVSEDVGKDVGENVGKNVGKNVGNSEDVSAVIAKYALSSNEGLVLNLIAKDSSITILDIASVVNVQTRTVERYLRKLKDLQLLERVGGKFGGHWKVINVGKDVGK